MILSREAAHRVAEAHRYLDSLRRERDDHAGELARVEALIPDAIEAVVEASRAAEEEFKAAVLVE